nr:indolepyruvate oxidoreductase subunit beta [Candidatus Njordarchaeum guaymaensis]
MKDYNTLITGIGGQGVLTTAQILARAGMFEGHKVLMAEIHGMSQRGGRVPCSVRFGDSINSSTIPEGGADLVISLEFAETLTSLSFASNKTVFVLNTQVTLPPMVTIGLTRYPTSDEVLRTIRQISTKLFLIDARAIAEKAGSPMTLNNVMLGAGVGAGRVPVSDKSITEAMKMLLPQRYFEVNFRAYQMGRNETLRSK